MHLIYLILFYRTIFNNKPKITDLKKAVDQVIIFRATECDVETGMMLGLIETASRYIFLLQFHWFDVI